MLCFIDLLTYKFYRSTIIHFTMSDACDNTMELFCTLRQLTFKKYHFADYVFCVVNGFAFSDYNTDEYIYYNTWVGL